ncbi:MAG TPA: penicillin-binding transpeptidase domain-containing protein, partial [Gaiellales bacterium]|nr:penicillin-binding transpeptidase domain-containing protein [Gaiellales bacterium]
GHAGYRYNGTGKVITAKYCEKIHCQLNMALTREQVGSSFKPYILAQAVKDGMNVQTSTLNGYNYLHIAPDSSPTVYSSAALPANSAGWSLPVGNDSSGENGPYTPQVAMGASINTAYADLWHRVAGSGGQDVLSMAQDFGVNIEASGLKSMANEYGIALGQASLTVTEQATMLATIDNGGIYHSAHVVTSITRSAAPSIPVKVTSYPVFSSNPEINEHEASQLQYAMSQVDNPSYGTAPNAAMSNGQEIVGKTGTTNKAQSAFFLGAIPSQALAVAFFTDNQSDTTKQTLDGLGGIAGGFGGTWPANIWHTYAEDQFVPLGVEPFPAPVFTGATWNQVPPGLRKVAKKHRKPNKNRDGNPGFPVGDGGDGGNGGGNPNPFPTYTCDPTVVTCTPGDGTQNAAANPAPAPAGAAGAVVIGVPATSLWVRRRQRKRTPGRG